LIARVKNLRSTLAGLRPSVSVLLSLCASPFLNSCLGTAQFIFPFSFYPSRVRANAVQHCRIFESNRPSATSAFDVENPQRAHGPASLSHSGFVTRFANIHTVNEWGSYTFGPSGVTCSVRICDSCPDEERQFRGVLQVLSYPTLFWQHRSE